EGAHVKMGAAMDTEPTVVRTAAEDRGAELMLVAPEFLLGGQIIRDRRVVRGCHVHHAVGDDRSVLERTELRYPGLENHAGDELGNVRRADVLESGVPLIPVVAAVRGPVSLGGCGRGNTEKRWNDQPSQAMLHRHSPQRMDRACM